MGVCRPALFAHELKLFIELRALTGGGCEADECPAVAKCHPRTPLRLARCRHSAAAAIIRQRSGATHCCPSPCTAVRE